MALDELGREIHKLLPYDGRKTVTTAGTRVALSATSLKVNSIIITAETDNTGLITVGASTVVAALATRQGTPLFAGSTVIMGEVDLADVYLDTTVDGDGVTYIYFQRT